MKKIPYQLLVLIIFLSGCHYTQKSDSVLRQTETFLVEFPDSALIVLENLYPGKNFDKYNRSLYYVLLTEARNKKGISLIESDSLIDYVIKNIDAKKHPDLSAKAYLFRGRIQNELRESDKAVEAFLKGISLLEKTDKDPTVLSKLYDELGTTYLDEFKSGKALEAFWKEYEIDRAIGDPRGIAFSLRNIGSVYLFREEPDSAFRYFAEALEYAGQSRDSVYLSDYIHNDLTVWYLEKGEYNDALLEIDKIKNLHESDLLNKAEALIYLGQADPARIFLSELVCSDDIFVRCTANEYLSEIAEQRSDFETALQYRKEYISETFKQKKQNNPKVTQEQFVPYCLSKLGFTSDEIGRFLSLSGSAIRYRVSKVL